MESHFTCHQNALRIQGTTGRIWSDTWWGRDFAGDLHLRRGDEEVSFELPRVNVYVPQIEHISEAVLSGTAPVISGERGLANVAVIRAAIEAARTWAYATGLGWRLGIGMTAQSLICNLRERGI